MTNKLILCTIFQKSAYIILIVGEKSDGIMWVH